MKLLSVQPATNYLSCLGGQAKAHRLFLEELAARGHVVRLIDTSFRAHTAAHAQFLDQARRLGIDVRSREGEDLYTYHGVDVHALVDPSTEPGLAPGYAAYVRRNLEELEPDWVLAVTDRVCEIVGTALELAPGRVVMVAHTIPGLPFGPEAFEEHAGRAALFKALAGCITVSNECTQYIRRWAGIDCRTQYLPAHGKGPFPELARFDSGAVALINPSGIKGISIFKALAEAFPGTPFAAVPTWATTSTDRRDLEKLRVSLLEPTDDLDALFAGIRILVVPSLWLESFGLVVIDAMVRGIPVVASDSAGIKEAKLGVDYVIPVNRIVRFDLGRLQDNMTALPTPEIPPQDFAPWRAALGRLLTDRAHYEALSRASRAAALEYVAKLSVAPFEAYLAELAAR